MSHHILSLFETVKSLQDKGIINLEASERSAIERETSELLRAARVHRTAANAPEGFNELLEKLKSVDADEAFSLVKEFLSKGEEKEEKEDKPMGKDNDMPKGLGKGKEDKPKGEEDKPMGKVDNADDDDDNDDMPKGLDKGKENKPMGKDNDMPKGKGKEDKPKGEEDKPMGLGLGKGKEDKPKGEDIDIEKGEILEKASKLLRSNVKEKDRDLSSLKEDETDEDSDSMASLGFKDAKAITARITAEGNVVVAKNGKPLFFHLTSKDIKKDANAVRRLANRLLSLTIHKGAKTAATMTNSKLVAGVDDDIVLNVQEDIPAASNSVYEDGETVFSEEEPKPANSTQDDAEFNTQENPKNAQSITEGAGLVNVQDDVDNNVKSTVDSDETNIKENRKDLDPDSIQDEADADFKTVEANLRELYKNRTAQSITKANNAFITKFIRAFKVATKRMALNQDEHEFKVAAYDVLKDYTDVVDEEAVDLAEMIASKAHDKFVDYALQRTSALIAKSDEYLKDAEEDLKTQMPKSTRDIKTNLDKNECDKSKSTKAKKISRLAQDGNFGLEGRMAVSSSFINNTKNGGLSDVVGNMPMSRYASALIEHKKGRI
jgi:hypothetical protein